MECCYCKYFKYSYIENGYINIYCKKEHSGMFAIKIAEDSPFVCGMIKLNRIGRKKIKTLTHQHEDKGE